MGTLEGIEEVEGGIGSGGGGGVEERKEGKWCV